MVKTEALNPEQRGIGSLLFRFPRCTRYPHREYYQALDLLINKDPDYYRQHRLSPILLFGIETKIINKNLGRHSMIKAKNVYYTIK